ncbi:MAG: winged helix DNA-binding protein [Fibrobacterales bacterium]|nr:winged helix DNA-binding protein [Fibrobacterales bacterium]MBP5351751.1 winged helix DNA-binding protein [Fibrobacterales bacterium]
MARENSLGFLLMKNSRVVARLYQRELMTSGITAPQSGIILVLNDGELCQSELSKALNLDKANASIMLKRMTEEGLVKGRKDAKDGRRVIYGLTPAGKKLVRKVVEADKAVAAEIISVVGEEAVKAGMEMLKKMHESRALR